jgi:hypothetical protein
MQKPDGSLVELESQIEWGAYEDLAAANTQSQQAAFKATAADYLENPEDTRYLYLWQGHMIHPGANGYNAVLGFKAPYDGTIDIAAYFRHYRSGVDGAQVQVLRLVGTELVQIYPAVDGVWLDVMRGTTPVRIEKQMALTDIEVTAGDMFYFVINCKEQLNNDAVYTDPQIRYTAYTLPEDVVTLNRTTLDLKVDAQGTLVVSIQPQESADKAVVWTSSDTTVATVSQFGVVTAKKAGTATIRAEIAGGAYAECEVTVTSDGAGPTDPGTDDPPAKGCKGCGTANASAVGIAVALIAVAGVALVLKKKP